MILLLSGCGTEKQDIHKPIFTGEPHFEIKVSDTVTKYVCGMCSMDSTGCQIYPIEYIDRENIERKKEIGVPERFWDIHTDYFADWKPDIMSITFAEECLFEFVDDYDLYSKYGEVYEEYKDIVWRSDRDTFCSFYTKSPEIFEKVTNSVLYTPDYEDDDGRVSCWIFEVYVENGKAIKVYQWPMIG